jgi:hypothetical protein
VRGTSQAEKETAVPNEEKSPEEATAMVKIRNTTPSSLSFRVPGSSIFLTPGEVLEVHKAYLETDELKALCRQGAVMIDQAAAPKGTTG